MLPSASTIKLLNYVIFVCKADTPLWKLFASLLKCNADWDIAVIDAIDAYTILYMGSINPPVFELPSINGKTECIVPVGDEEVNGVL